MLQEMGYDSDPVRAWKQAQEKVGHGVHLSEVNNQHLGSFL